MLQDIKVLCICVLHTIRDPYCQEKMCAVAIHSEELFAIDKRSRSGRSSTLPGSFLRRLTLKSLEDFEDRLRAFETTGQSDDGVVTKAATRISLGDRSPVGRRRAAPYLT